MKGGAECAARTKATGGAAGKGQHARSGFKFEECYGATIW